MRNPTHLVEIGRDRNLPAGEGQRRTTVQRRMTARRVGIPLEVRQLAFQIAPIPERHLVEEFPTDGADQALHTGM